MSKMDTKLGSGDSLGAKNKNLDSVEMSRYTRCTWNQ